MTFFQSGTAPRDAMRLHLEFAIFFVAAPVLTAVILPPRQMFSALFAFTLLGIVLLVRTPDFSWRGLARNARNWRFRELVVFAAIVATASIATVRATNVPNEAILIIERPEILIMIWIGYPIVSALPQELLFRPLFYIRYKTILPDGLRADVLNAGIFALAHLMYWSWIVALYTFVGSLVFSWAYRTRGSFLLTLLLHAIAGNILFALGMGAYFYSGNVTKPF